MKSLKCLVLQCSFAGSWIVFLFMSGFAAARADDFAIIQDRLLNASSLGSLGCVNINYSGLNLITNPCNSGAPLLDVTQTPSQALVDEAMQYVSVSGSFTDINYGTSVDTIMNHFRRLIILGLAHRTPPATPYSGYTDAAISSAIINGLQYWVTNYSHINGTILYTPAWYPNSYGAVVLLVPDLVKLNPTLWSQSTAYLKGYYHSVNCFAANGQQPFRAALIGCVLERDSTATLALTTDYIKTELGCSGRENDKSVLNIDEPFGLVEGFQTDYSFVQHGAGGRTNYWGHYGGGFVTNLPELMKLTNGTFCSLSSGIPYVTDAIENGLQWAYYSYSGVDLQTNGRMYETLYSLASLQTSYTQLASIAGAEGYPSCQATLSRLNSTIIGGKQTSLRGDQMFWRTDFHAHRAAGWGTSVRMSSLRTVSCEAATGTSEGLNNHYTGSGALYLVQTGGEYKGVVSGEPADHTALSWNWRRLPGITVEQYPKTTLLPTHEWGNGGNGGTTFAGGASDGTYGVVGYKHLLADCTGSQPVTAYKAVFFFDNEYVMAGAGIAETSGSYPVVTTINQTRLYATNTGSNVISCFASGVTTDIPLSSSTNPTMFTSGSAWVLSGSTGYVFPVSSGTYSFQQLYTSGSATPTKDDLFWLGIDHGKNPSNGTYWCIVRPNTTGTNLAAYVANPDIVLTVNTAQAQGAFGPNQVFEGIYYTGTGGTISGTSWLRSVTVDQPCALILRPDSTTTPTQLLLTLSNPQCESVNIPTVNVRIRTTFNLAGAVPNGDGTYTLTMPVALPTDPGYKGSSQMTSLPITSTAAPGIASGLTATGTNGQAFSYQIPASNWPTSYSATGLPTGLSLSASTGLISGTPAVTGTFITPLSAVNPIGTGTASLKIIVAPPVPIITNVLTATGTSGQPFRCQIPASYSPTSYSATGLPAGLSIDSGLGVISGTLTSAAGTYTSTVSASNSSGTGSAQWTLTVIAPGISSALTTTATAGKAFSYQITGTNAPTTYTAAGLPTGLSLNSTGFISGTAVLSGCYLVPLLATGSNGAVGAALTMIVVQTTPLIANSSFETPTVGISSYKYNPTGGSWTFLNNSGIQSNSSGWNAPSAPLGTQTAFLQISTGGTGGSLSQSVNLNVSGAYYLSFLSALRPPPYTGPISFNVLVDGTAVGTYSPVTMNSFTAYTTAPFTISTPGSHSVQFATVATSASDSSVFIDSVILAQLPVPIVTSPLSVTATNGQPFSYQIAGSNNPTSYGATGLPAGLFVSATTGLISGTPTSVAGTYAPTISAINLAGTGSAVLTITLAMPITALESMPPTLTTTGGSIQLGVSNSTVGHTYQVQRTSALNAPTVWQNIGPLQPGTNRSLILSDTTGTAGPRAFYRLKISSP